MGTKYGKSGLYALLSGRVAEGFACMRGITGWTTAQLLDQIEDVVSAYVADGYLHPTEVAGVCDAVSAWLTDTEGQDRDALCDKAAEEAQIRAEEEAKAADARCAEYAREWADQEDRLSKLIPERLGLSRRWARELLRRKGATDAAIQEGDLQMALMFSDMAEKPAGVRLADPRGGVSPSAVRAVLEGDGMGDVLRVGFFVEDDGSATWFSKVEGQVPDDKEDDTMEHPKWPETVRRAKTLEAAVAATISDYSERVGVSIQGEHLPEDEEVSGLLWDFKWGPNSGKDEFGRLVLFDEFRSRTDIDVRRDYPAVFSRLGLPACTS